MVIAVGETAPDFELKDSSGEVFRLSDLRGLKRVLLVFYPKDMTSGCTDQLVAVSDSINSMRKNDVEPIGVNPDSAESHQEFRKMHDFPFELLVDEDRGVATAYGAVKEDGSGISRSVVVVGLNGKVIFSQSGAPAWPTVANVIKAADDRL